MATYEDIKTYEQALIEKFGSSTVLCYTSISYTIFSVARYYGGCNIGGQEFIYNPEDDSLIRADVVKWINKQKRKAPNGTDQRQKTQAP